MNSTAQFQRSFFSVASTGVGARKAEPRGTETFANTLAATAGRQGREAEASQVEQVIAAKGKGIPFVASGMLGRAWQWLTRNRAFGAEKQLRVVETLSLGEKRFVALLQVEGRKFLIGGGASGVSLLTPLDAASDADGLVRTGAGERTR